MDSLTTYFLGSSVYLVDSARDIAYVYSREGKYLGVGNGFEDYLYYSGHKGLPTSDKE